MSITSHKAVISALEDRTARFTNKGKLSNLEDRLFSSALDETGTVDITQCVDDGVDVLWGDESQRLALLQQQEINNLREYGITEEVQRIHGILPASKGEGCIRLLYENVNGINNRISNNDKVEKAKEMIDELEADVVAFNEHRLNMRHKDNVNGFSQLFRGGEAVIQSVVSHNINENISRVQEGGTCMMAIGPITDYIAHANRQEGKDITGLGRWSVITLQGEGFKTRMVCGYNPCYNNNPSSSTSYQQHRRFFINKKKDLTCPRTKFRDDLIAQLKKWRDEGDRLIVCLDANENIYKKSIGKALTALDGLAMTEVVGAYTGEQIGATFFRGSNPIDGIWATSDITVVNACIMPAGYGIGDHRLFVIDLCETDITGKHRPAVVRPMSRKLITKIPGVANRYNEILESSIIKHRLIEKLGRAYRTKSKRRCQRRLNKIDVEATLYMRHAEKKCRRFKSGRISFSPEASMWIRRTQTYRSLLRFHAGKIRNVGNLKRSAKRCGILDAMSLSVKEIYDRLLICMSQCDYFRKNGKAYRNKHLRDCLQSARDKEDEEAENQIAAIISRERERGKWRRLNYVLGKQRAGACFKVQLEDEEGTTVEFSSKQEVQEAIWANIHKKRFYLAEDAPICSGTLRGSFGYNAVTKTARDILSGSYVFPPDFDQATREILEECALIRRTIPKNSVSTVISPSDWNGHFRKVKEKTSSSISTRHFGHYIAGLKSEHISFFESQVANLVVNRGMVLDRWSSGLSVMLEKIAGCIQINKLRSILLMEADFNAANKIIFAVRMMANVRKYKFMPDEVYSERNRMADDGTLAKVLFYDITRQLRRPAGLASVDADNCYDRIAHPMLSMVMQAFGVPSNAAVSMLSTIQDMKFHLRTGYGDSEDYVGGPLGNSTDVPKPQGTMQGNGAGPASWTVTSIPMISAHKKKGHGAHLVASITDKTGHIAGNLFVDDTDLIHLNMINKESKVMAHDEFQNSIINWGKLLIATGGALKPSKCSYYLISFMWNKEGQWKYEQNEVAEEWEIGVPLADGNMAAIEHLSVDSAVKTLGSMTCPSGSNKAAIIRMKSQCDEWYNRLIIGSLSRREVWFMCEVQLWPRVGFGICNNTAPWDELDNCLNVLYGKIGRKGGIRGSAPKILRTLDRGFFGVGFPHPGLECFVAQVTKLLVHYGCRSSLGLQMLVSLELMIVELGLSAQPFSLSFNKYHSWTTHSWLKSIWEKACKFSVTIETMPIPIEPPRENDKWFMQAIEDMGAYSEKQKEIINRFRCHQQVLFVSCIMDAGGRAVDPKYLNLRNNSESWSSLIFPNEQPPHKHLKIWKAAVHGVIRRLGRFKSRDHKIWEYRYDEEANEILHLKSTSTMDIYFKSLVPRYNNRPNCYTRGRIDVPLENRGVICSIKQVALAVIGVQSTTTPLPDKITATSFWEIVQSWGQTWLWDNIQLSGDLNWLAEAIEDNCLVAVTDGSYMKERYPNLNSAAFIFECSKGRGRLMGSFTECTPDAGSYRGELLGLMAIHLILLGVNTFHTGIKGSVHIWSDCMGALEKVEYLPPYRIPTRCSHGDILKNILVNCSDLTFSRKFSHVPAHQDDHTNYEDLSRPSQLNCQMDYQAKLNIWDREEYSTEKTERLPLEPICILLGNNKLTANNCNALRFWVNKQIAKATFYERKIMFGRVFDSVDWECVHEALWDVPRMFAIWASKQVTGTFAANDNKPWDKSNIYCPSCATVPESCEHILRCNNAGRVETLLKSIDLLESWLEEVDTDQRLVECITGFAKGRGGISMTDICRGSHMGQRYIAMAEEQDTIGWRRFMEGMVSRKLREIQTDYSEIEGSNIAPKLWGRGLVIKLLEATHGQWIYRCVQTHDKLSGTIATVRKEAIQKEIETQQDMGIGDDWEREDRYLAEVNLEDLELSSGNNQEYWLLAIRTAREASRLRRQLQQPVSSNRTTKRRRDSIR